MTRYLHQLLDELRAARGRRPPSVDYRLLHSEYGDVPDDLRYVVEWELAPERPLPDLFGIPAEAFPPPEQLSEEQAGQVVEGILELWRAWDIYADIPKGVPVPTVYRVLHRYWKEETIHWVSDGMITLEFCHYEPDECPWGKTYCTCTELLPPDEQNI